MRFISQIVKKYPFSVVCIAMIWVLSLVPFFPETPLNGVKFIDKWVHILMYGGAFTVLWIEYIWQHRTADYEKLFFWAWLMPVAMGGFLELLQEYCTAGHRNGDWLDFAANTTGVTVAGVIGLAIWLIKKRGR